MIDWRNPYHLVEALWPHVSFYDKQRMAIESVDFNDETFVVAGNMLGKDFIAGFIALRYFLRYGGARGGCRIVTTSVKDDHLRVLWGEIGRFIATSRVPLRRALGGPLLYNHHDIRWVGDDGIVNDISYLRGMVSERGEGMAGHHARYTLAILDEASGIDDIVYDQVRTWARRILVIGNPMPCNNFWFKAVKGGDIPVGYKTTDADAEMALE